MSKELGSILNPITNNFDLTRAVKGKRDTFIFVKLFDMNEFNYWYIQQSNIRLLLESDFKNKKEIDFIISFCKNTNCPLCSWQIEFLDKALTKYKNGTLNMTLNVVKKS